MKRWPLAILVSTSAFGVEIPLAGFDQLKLESLLRTIPQSFVREEAQNGFVRKFYQFPKSQNPNQDQNKSSEFIINCEGDYYRSSKIASFARCKLNTNNKNQRGGDEFLMKITSPDIVGPLFQAIPYSDKVKKYYSGEYFDGVAHTGAFQNIFRYSFVCTPNSCDMTFSTKDNPE